ncbi:MAG: hypothetical protein KKD18_07100 [Nanoarchaeota archaeon]|nr:hypothetical protein [Nanoarchaeota archaeon]MBU0978159.1 hypothetical protein [Nanoarchaeota archaeon]
MNVVNFNLSGNFFTSLTFSEDLAVAVLVLLATLVVASLFIFKFYKSLSKRNLISLNLYKYNTSDHPVTSKIVAMLFYLIEYIFFIPFLIMLWFAGIAILISLISSESLTVDYILWISAALIGAIRVLSYIRGEIATDLAKLFPFTTLSFLLLSAGGFNLDLLMENLRSIPSLLDHILSFILVVLVVEIFMRIIYTLIEFWKSEGGEVSSKKETQPQEDE